MTMTTVLICDDNIAVHESLTLYLKEANINVISAYDGESALQTLRSTSVQLLILDLMLPGQFGLDILKELRTFSDIPVLILSAKDSEFDRVLGLELGADDYVIKPFSPKEVVTRVKVILKRMDKSPKHHELSFANLRVNTDSYTAFVGEEALNLTAKELEILALFAEKLDTVLTRDRIMNTIWGYKYYGDTRAVDTQIMRIRQKLPETAEFELSSVYGVGYKLVRK